MDECIFCKIAKHELPAEVVYEDELMVAFLDIKPVNYGHTLIIPKDHYRSLVNVPDPLLGDLFRAAKRLTLAVREGTKADYVALTVVGVDIPHFHIHLIPRYFNDGLASFWPTKKYNEGEQKRYGDLIRSKVI